MDREEGVHVKYTLAWDHVFLRTILDGQFHFGVVSNMYASHLRWKMQSDVWGSDSDQARGSNSYYGSQLCAEFHHYY